MSDKAKTFLLYLAIAIAIMHFSERKPTTPDQPILGSDFDCDGKTDIAVWRSSDGTWYILLSSRDWDRSHPLIRQWGSKGDKPIGNSDFDGDGKTDMAVWRPSDATWYILLSSRDWDRSNPLIRQWGDREQ
jgi:hypothetical protein